MGLNYHCKPQITLQKALMLAETFIDSEHIDISTFYLGSANMIDFGPKEGPKELSWYFWWLNEDGADGHYVEIVVSMKGVVRRIPSM
jgi:hypothetical protein